MQKFMIELPSGDYLVAEETPCHVGGQISIGIENKEGTWIQDLVVVESNFNGNEYVKDEFNTYVFGNEYDEGYTECFLIKRIPDKNLEGD